MPVPCAFFFLRRSFRTPPFFSAPGHSFRSLGPRHGALPSLLPERAEGSERLRKVPDGSERLRTPPPAAAGAILQAFAECADRAAACCGAPSSAGSRRAAERHFAVRPRLLRNASAKDPETSDVKDPETAAVRGTETATLKGPETAAFPCGAQTLFFESGVPCRRPGA